MFAREGSHAGGKMDGAAGGEECADDLCVCTAWVYMKDAGRSAGEAAGGARREGGGGARGRTDAESGGGGSGRAREGG